ncbi:MAG: TIGR03435 family protein [Ignavibacteriota bacterium]
MILHAQSDWQTAAGGKQEFDAASVKLDTGDFRPPGFPLDNGNAFKPGGRFSSDFGVITYVQFAYKVRFTEQQIQAMQARLPKWIFSDRYAIDAKADGLPTKDQFRLMMQSLLAERFQLVVHFETQDATVYALTLVKPGILGPKLRHHSDGPGCESGSATAFPPQCYVQMAMMKARSVRMGSRATTMERFAEAIPGSGSKVDRTVVDQTGIAGEVDYEIEWIGEVNPNGPPEASPPPPDPGPTFLQALREQLGLKLEPARLPLRVLAIDRVERPTEN